MQLRVSEGKHSLEEETGPGTKLGIVKLGKVAGKVSLSFSIRSWKVSPRKEMKVLTKCPKCLSFSQTYKLLGLLLY